MPRYIDADILNQEIDKLQTELSSNNDAIWKRNKPIYKGLCFARGIINDIPTADVVEVCRCSSCSYYEEVDYYPDGSKHICRLLNRQMHPNDFCSYGDKDNVKS